jgi:glyoxylase-like metal-dependent hydrolase (beta-lactamase superfamily II)
MITTTLLKPARAVLLAVAFSALCAPAAFAAAPLAKTSAPGYFRMMLGEFEVTALSDGTIELPMNKLLTNTTPEKVDRALKKAFLKSPLETSFNAYLINTGSKLVLVDGGAGKLFGSPNLGQMLANLRASGYQPEQVDEIYLTHMHVDHVGGLSADGQAVFPNAIVRAAKHESDYWLSPENLERAPAEQKGYFEGAVASMTPYVKAGKYLPFEGDVEFWPGLRAQARPGHTAGHTSYVVESRGQKLVLIGDLVHVGAVQFAEPNVTIAFDGNAKEAAASRRKAFAEAARSGELIGAAHLSFPALGHVRASGKAFEWLPVNYTQMH